MSDPFSDFPLANDNDFDAFECGTLALKIARLFENRSAPPSNIAIYGPWGSGKSSLLYLLKKQLDTSLGKNAPLWIEIDAWAYQTEDTLIYAILAALYQKAKQPVTESLLRIALGTTLSLADLALKFATDKNLSVKEVAEHLELAEGTKPFESKHLVLRDEFAKVVGKLRKSRGTDLGRHVLVTIDNLDRCKPDAAIKVLETLFLVGNTSDCTFLLAVDQHVLMSFLNRQYEGTQFNGARYLEKIFPIAFRIPDPWVYWNYSQALLYMRHEKPKEPDQVYVYLDRLLKGTKWDDRVSSAKHGEEDRSIFATAWHYFAQPRVLRNPRRIKRIVRIIRGYEPDDQPDAEKLLFLVILTDLWPDALEFLLSTDGATWKAWIDHLAMQTNPAPPNGILLKDQGLRDFINQIWAFHDQDRKKFDDFKKKCPIRKQEMLFFHLKYLRELGL